MNAPRFAPRFALLLGLSAALAGPALAQNEPTYEDDRSTAGDVISSYYNAINRQEYLRAWSYYRPDNAPDWPSFEKGYEDTANVSLKLGEAVADPGAGSYYWYQPVAISSESTDGTTQVYAGCYTLLLSSPSAQATPPYQPMGITEGHMKAVSTSLDESVPSSCPEN